MVKEKLLISACFLSPGYKYDGTDNIKADILKLKEKYDLIPVCPEVMGGLSVPRLPSEEKDGKVYMIDGRDVTLNFISGSKKALDILKENQITKALLKAKSPSCGYGKIYDGTFTHTLKEGGGVFARMLIKEGIEIITENELEKL